MAIHTPAGKEGMHPCHPGSANRAVSIASVTVAYNGAHTLLRHLDARKGQSQKVNEIVVVNNASTDSALDLLMARFPEVTVLNLAANGGVGGGLAAGLEYAAIAKKL